MDNLILFIFQRDENVGGKGANGGKCTSIFFPLTKVHKHVSCSKTEKVGQL